MLTPVPPASWRSAEADLSGAGFRVEPASAEGLATLAARLGSAESGGPASATAREAARPLDPIPTLPSRLQEDPRQWLDRIPPPTDEVERLIRELKWYLGEDFDWLASCAAYPELHWRLTLELGRVLAVADRREPMDVVGLARLVRLPWFRYGSLPDWLRLRLMADLPRDRQALIREALGALLVGAEAVRETSVDGVLVTIASAVRRTLARRQPDGPLQDYVFATFLDGRMPGPLDFAIPPEAREVLRAAARSRELARNEAAVAQELFSKSRRRIQPLRWWDGIVAFLLGATVSAGGLVLIAGFLYEADRIVSRRNVPVWVLICIALQSSLMYLPIRVARGRQLRWPLLIGPIFWTLSLLGFLSLFLVVTVGDTLEEIQLVNATQLWDPWILGISAIFLLLFGSPLFWSFVQKRQQAGLLLHKYLLRWSSLVMAFILICGGILICGAVLFDRKYFRETIRISMGATFGIQIAALGQALAFAYFRRVRGSGIL